MFWGWGGGSLALTGSDRLCENQLCRLWCRFILLFLGGGYTQQTYEVRGRCACACAQIKGNIKSLSFSALQKTHKVTADEVKGRFGGGCQGSGCESATLMMLMCYYSFHVLNPLWTCALLCVVLRNLPGKGTLSSSSLHRNTVITMHLSNPSSDSSHIQLVFIHVVTEEHLCVFKC